MLKELHALYKDRKISVRNHWVNGAELVVDGEQMDTCDKLISTSASEPVMSATIETTDGQETIDVYIVAILTTKIKILVNGIFIAGENI